MAIGCWEIWEVDSCCEFGVIYDFWFEFSFLGRVVGEGFGMVRWLMWLV